MIESQCRLWVSWIFLNCPLKPGKTRFYLSTNLDDFSSYIFAWKLCTTIKTQDVTETLELALQASGLERANIAHRPRLQSDYEPCCISAISRSGSTIGT